MTKIPSPPLSRTHPQTPPLLNCRNSFPSSARICHACSHVSSPQLLLRYARSPLLHTRSRRFFAPSRRETPTPVAAKDNFLGKCIYKDTLARNLAAVIYRNEKEIQKTAFKQYRVLQTAKEFRYGYKLVENTNVRSALGTNDVIGLPTPDQLKTVFDKVKDYFGEAKESFGKMTTLNTGDDESSA